MSNVHINYTRYDAVWAEVSFCPNCNRKRKFVRRHQPWYGVHDTCLACGDSWDDGTMMERPFAPRWRKESIQHAKELLAECGVTKAQAWAAIRRGLDELALAERRARGGGERP